RRGAAAPVRRRPRRSRRRPARRHPRDRSTRAGAVRRRLLELRPAQLRGRSRRGSAPDCAPPAFGRRRHRLGDRPRLPVGNCAVPGARPLVARRHPLPPRRGAGAARRAHGVDPLLHARRLHADLRRRRVCAGCPARARAAGAAAVPRCLCRPPSAPDRHAAARRGSRRRVAGRARLGRPLPDRAAKAMTLVEAAWLPRLACPDCRTDLGVPAGDDVACAASARTFELRGGVWRFLTPSRGQALDPFVQQYRAVREREGRRRATPEYYHRLPSVAADDPHAGDWTLRRETYHHLLRHVLAGLPLPIQALDVGAGSGWLCHRLTALGHHAVAVDAIDDEVDGLGAARHYETPFPIVQADFDALPFAPGQFGLVVFNGSLHYAADVAATLAGARRLLAP